MTDREALKLALETLEEIADEVFSPYDNKLGGAILAIREVLAQPEQEPVVGQPLPCPFCGHIGLDFSDGNTYRWGIASCGGCGASCGDIRREYPDEGKWHSEAIAEWNRRTTPPKREWVGLTEAERVDIIDIEIDAPKTEHFALAQSIEAALKEKNK